MTKYLNKTTDYNIMDRLDIFLYYYGIVFEELIFKICRTSDLFIISIINIDDKNALALLTLEEDLRRYFPIIKEICYNARENIISIYFYSDLKYLLTFN